MRVKNIWKRPVTVTQSHLSFKVSPPKMCKDILRFLVRIFFHLIFSIFQTSLISNVNDCHESWSFDFSFVYLCFKDVKSFLSVMINQWNMLMMPLQSLGLTERFQSWLVVNYSLLAADSRCSLSSREIVLCCSLCKVWVMSGDELFLSTFSCSPCPPEWDGQQEGLL